MKCSLCTKVHKVQKYSVLFLLHLNNCATVETMQWKWHSDKAPALPPGWRTLRMVWGNWSSELKPDQRFFDWCPLVLEEQKATSHGTCSEIVSWFDCQDWVWWSRANSRNLQWSQWSTSGCAFDVFVLLCEVWMFWGETFWSGSMCLWN